MDAIENRIAVHRFWTAVLIGTAAMLLTLASPAHADYVTATVAVGSSPLAVTVNPVTYRVYVVNRGSSSVSETGVSAYELRASGYARGVYLLRLEGEGSTATRTLIVNSERSARRQTER